MASLHMICSHNLPDNRDSDIFGIEIEEGEGTIAQIERGEGSPQYEGEELHCSFRGLIDGEMLKLLGNGSLQWLFVNRPVTQVLQTNV